MEDTIMGGFFSKLRAAHQYTRMAVKADLERDEAAKILNELRAILSANRTEVVEAARQAEQEPRLRPIHLALKRNIAACEDTCAAYENAVRTCEAVRQSLDAACKNYDWQSVETASMTATGAVHLAKAAHAQAINVNNEFRVTVTEVAQRMMADAQKPSRA
jgi:hypothetical protein